MHANFPSLARSCGRNSSSLNTWAIYFKEQNRSTWQLQTPPIGQSVFYSPRPLSLQDAFSRSTEGGRSNLSEDDHSAFAVTLQTEINRLEPSKAANVAGYIRGNDPRKWRKAVVVGAGIDHQGLHEVTGAPYLGANDNASGIASMLELVELLQDQRANESIIFVGWNGYERDMAGVRHFFREIVNSEFQVSGFIDLKSMAYAENDSLIRARVTFNHANSNLNKTVTETITEWKIILDEVNNTNSSVYQGAGSGEGYQISGVTISGEYMRNKRSPASTTSPTAATRRSSIQPCARTSTTEVRSSTGRT